MRSGNETIENETVLVNNANDLFPGDRFCEILVSFDKDGVMIIHDIKYGGMKTPEQEKYET